MVVQKLVFWLIVYLVKGRWAIRFKDLVALVGKGSSPSIPILQGLMNIVSFLATQWCLARNSGGCLLQFPPESPRCVPSHDVT